MQNFVFILVFMLDFVFFFYVFIFPVLSFMECLQSWHRGVFFFFLTLMDFNILNENSKWTCCFVVIYDDVLAQGMSPQR